jgi:hypothetical protein
VTVDEAEIEYQKLIEFNGCTCLNCCGRWQQVAETFRKAYRW